MRGLRPCILLQKVGTLNLCTAYCKPALTRTRQTMMDSRPCMLLPKMASQQLHAACYRQRSYDGRTSMHVAAANGHTAVVRCLLDGNAGMDKASISGTTPMLSAAQHGGQQVVRCLQEAGADSRGMTPMHFAVAFGNLELMRSLLKASADNDRADKDGRSADENQLGNEGITPMHVAATLGHTELVRRLLEAGAHIHRANDGNAPSHVAAQLGRPEAVSCLPKQDVTKIRRARMEKQPCSWPSDTTRTLCGCCNRMQQTSPMGT